MAIGVQIKEIAKTYQRPGAESVNALTETDIDIRPGEFFSLVGPSGCGKTTLLNMVAGLLPPTAGAVMIGERHVEGPDPSTGIVFQRATLLRWLTVYENVLLPSTVHRSVTDKTRSQADHLLGLTGLVDYKHRYPSELSGGMQQRAAIVRALVGEPTVLLMDEPFSALDEFTRETLNDELLRLWTEQPKTVLFITHNITEAVYLSDRVGVMNAHPGRLATVIDVNLSRPRLPSLRSEAGFYDIVREVRGLIGPTEAPTTRPAQSGVSL